MNTHIEFRRPGPPTRRPGLRRAVVALALAGTLIALSACAPDATGLPTVIDGPTALGLATPPLDLDDVPPNIADHYRFADTHQDVYDDIPCFCGCEKSIGHRNLTDCFVRSDGTGWDAHAAGCAVCIDESVAVRRLMADGATTPTIRQSIITDFGAFTTPSTPTTSHPTT